MSPRRSASGLSSVDQLQDALMSYIPTFSKIAFLIGFIPIATAIGACNKKGDPPMDAEVLVDASNDDMESMTDAGPDSETDGNDDDLGVDMSCSTQAPGRPVDLLLVVDDSASMAEEQARLIEGAGRFLESLVLGRDIEGTIGAFPIVDDLHVGVITTDMGAGGNDIVNCNSPDDGILRVTDSNDEFCDGLGGLRYSKYRGGDSLSDFTRRTQCLASVGVDGCGFERPLDALAKALLPEEGPPNFPPGRGDTSNAGFFREDAVLVVMVLSDESDCSVQPGSEDLWNPNSAEYEQQYLAVRCELHPEVMRPAADFAEAIMTHRVGAVDQRVVFAPLVGVPTNLVSQPLAAILAHPSQQVQVVQVEHRPEVHPSCTSADGATRATPAPRILRLGQEIEARGGRAAVGSICAMSYDSFFDRVLTEVQPLTQREACGS